MRILHISHNDLDGVGCGILIKKFLPQNSFPRVTDSLTPQVTKKDSEKQRKCCRTYGEELSHVKVCTDSRDSLFLQRNVIRQRANE